MKRQFNVDKFHKAAVVMTEIHNMVHRGYLFSASHIFTGVIDTASADLLIVVGPAQGAHIRLGLSTTGQGIGFFYSEPTVTVPGTAVTPSNRNGFSSRTLSGITITHTPTITDVGTETIATVVPGGEKVRAVGASEEGFSEWILAPGTYLLRFTNNAGTTVNVSLELELYQPDSR